MKSISRKRDLLNTCAPCLILIALMLMAHADTQIQGNHGAIYVLAADCREKPFSAALVKHDYLLLSL